MNSTIDPELDALFAEYYLLKAKHGADAAERAGWPSSRRRLDGLDVLGTTRRERLVYEAADDYVAQADAMADPRRPARAEGVDEAEDREIWERAAAGGSPSHDPRRGLPERSAGARRQGRDRAARGARTHFGDPTLAGTAFTFAAYKPSPSRRRSNAAFKFKCAYCESVLRRDAAARRRALPAEERRARAPATKADAGACYYWLAARWGNLLPSCTDCNRARTQALPDGTTQTLGKANQFPIASEAKRATKAGRGEGRGAAAASTPRSTAPRATSSSSPTGSSGGSVGKPPSRKGRESIRVYALLRAGSCAGAPGFELELRTHISIARGLGAQARGGRPRRRPEGAPARGAAGARSVVAARARVQRRSRRQLIDPVLARLRNLT